MNEVLLLSGGIDSISLAFERRPAVALTIDYGQRAAGKELEVSGYIAKQLGIDHRIVRLDLAAIGSGLMASLEAHSAAPTPEWWPFRNQLLITVAGMVALREGLPAIVVGTVVSDADHADGTSQFMDCCRNLLACQEGSVLLYSPALQVTSVELVRRSGIPASLLASAHSCHRGDAACGRCRGCFKHESVFEEVGLL